MVQERDAAHLENENIMVRLWSKYFPYWPVFLILMVLSVGCAWLYLRYKLPVYESTATLLVKDEKKGLQDSKIIESLNPLSSKKIIDNEIEVIKSRALMNQVVHSLFLYAPVSEAGKWRDVSAYYTSPVKIEVKTPDSLVEVAKVDFSYDENRKMVRLNRQMYLLDKWVITPWGQLRFTQNNKNSVNKLPLYFSLINPKRITQSLINTLEVASAGKQTSVVNLKLKDEVPQRSEDILNGLITAYDQASVNDNYKLAENTLSFLDERMRIVSADLANVEKQLQQYKASKGAIDIGIQGRIFLQNVSENDKKLSDVNIKLAVLKQVEEYIATNDHRGSLVPSTVGVDDPVLTGLLNKLYESELQYEKLKRTTGENNTELVALTDQIQKIKPGLLENLHSQQRILEANKQNLVTDNQSYASSLQALPQQERDLVEISREQNIKSSIYSFILQKREETALSLSSKVSDTRIVDKAEFALDPVGRSSKSVYIIAFLMSIGLGIALIYVCELFNRTILFRQEIENLTSFPVIGEIALEKSRGTLVVQEGRTTFIAEEFRMLRTSLHYLGIGSKGKKILVTSTIPGEGKSFVAANLAMSMATSGKKVILVEFDLSNPSLAYKLGIEANKGVANYLAGNVEASDVILRTGENPDLFLMTAGNLPYNPSDLILHERTVKLLHYLENRFDYILLDSAPVGLLSDGYILSRHCDATLFVVRHKHTPKRMLKRLEQNNKINELKNLAIVFNGVGRRGFASNAYGYGYGYGSDYVGSYNQKQKTSKKIL